MVKNCIYKRKRYVLKAITNDESNLYLDNHWRYTNDINNAQIYRKSTAYSYRGFFNRDVSPDNTWGRIFPVRLVVLDIKESKADD